MSVEFLKSWSAAERTVFDALLTATGSVEKQNAYLGYIPPAVNLWAFKMGGGGSVEENWNTAVTVMHMNAEIQGVFDDRDRAQQFALKVMTALPVWRKGNVQCFRLRSGGMPDVLGKFLQLANQQQESLCWAVTIGFEIVFNTMETY